ncbi:hypothetical protein [Prosthecomicrobium pneumaticum]|uniref:Uncharacterized protein n=1 Tax=Prosthecomicrobium pneumaticum TaxID=81895 RepID=A0A7W9FLN5_9HYPH|nr:hypothetical protein [Prosthecomicrobium pneumaticum]MBB5752958.1 hypothetical protein [Prosthecomicrobium pneumaticum]
MILYRAAKRADELRQICLEELAVHAPTRGVAGLEIVVVDEGGRTWDAVNIRRYDDRPAEGDLLRAARERIDLQRDLFTLSG